jgi:hypothetical protein
MTANRPPLFGDVNTDDLTRGASWLAHYSRGNDAEALNHVLNDAAAADGLRKLPIAVCHLLAYMQAPVFVPNGAEWWGNTAALLLASGAPTPGW